MFAAVGLICKFSKLSKRTAHKRHAKFAFKSLIEIVSLIKCLNKVVKKEEKTQLTEGYFIVSEQNPVERPTGLSLENTKQTKST